jgi:hypothetical protein
MPGWVVDYVLVHELAHLIEIGHGPRFYRLVDAFPKAERARGYLLGVVAGAGWAAEPDALDQESADDAGADDVRDDIRDDAAEAKPDTDAGPGLKTNSTTEPGRTTQAELDALW